MEETIRLLAVRPAQSSNGAGIYIQKVTPRGATVSPIHWIRETMANGTPLFTPEVSFRVAPKAVAPLKEGEYPEQRVSIDADEVLAAGMMLARMYPNRAKQVRELVQGRIAAPTMTRAPYQPPVPRNPAQEAPNAPETPAPEQNLDASLDGVDIPF